MKIFNNLSCQENKCKPKLYWNSISPQSDWLSPRVRILARMELGRKLYYIAEMKTNQSSHYGNQYGRFFRNGKQNDPTIQPKGYPGTEVRGYQRYLHTHVYRSISHSYQLMKQPLCPSVDEWRKRHIHIHYKFMLFVKKKKKGGTGDHHIK